MQPTLSAPTRRSRLDEFPDKVWVMAVDPAGRALVWSAFQPCERDDAAVQCVNSFERPETWDDDLCALVYAARHELIVISTPSPTCSMSRWSSTAGTRTAGRAAHRTACR